MIHPFSLTLDEWIQTLMDHLPRGIAWKDPDGRLARLMAGLAPELKRFHDPLLALYRGLDRTRMAGSVLQAWEVACALPDPDFPVPPTEAERLAVALGRMTRRHWKQTVGHYIALAALNGVTVAIDRPAGYVSTFRVTTSGTEWTTAHYGTAVYGDPYGSLTEVGEAVQRSFERRKRAHARIVWDNAP